MKTWREIQRDNFTKREELCDFLQLDPPSRETVLSFSLFPLSIPLRIAQKIKKNCLSDPLFIQFVPTTKESLTTPGFCSDPVNDQSFRQAPKLLSKYKGRSLILCTSACAMHCRYCFRQNFPYEVSSPGLFAQEIAAIAKQTDVSEVLLSGGDPLSLSDSSLQALFDKLSNIPHVKRVRIHTRFPIGIPERITPQLLDIFSTGRLQKYFVIHCNHKNELDADILQALKKVQQTGTPVLNQTVLLRGVNDSVEALKELCESLIDHGILPYYLHQLDKIRGGAHFEVSQDEGIALMKELRRHLPGYALPQYVHEIPGKEHKTLII